MGYGLTQRWISDAHHLDWETTYQQLRGSFLSIPHPKKERLPKTRQAFVRDIRARCVRGTYATETHRRYAA